MIEPLIVYPGIALVVITYLAGPISVFFPKAIIRLNGKVPFLLPILYVIAFLSVGMFVFYGSWSTETRVAELNPYNLINIISRFSFIFILLSIVHFTWLGMYLQKWTLKNERSFSVALLGGLLTGPTLFYFLFELFI